MFALELQELCAQLFLQAFCHHLLIPLQQHARKVELAVNITQIVSQIAARKVTTNVLLHNQGPPQIVPNVLTTLRHSWTLKIHVHLICLLVQRCLLVELS